MKILSRIVPLLFFIVIGSPAISQPIKWPSPEVEELYKSAQASLASGAFRQAIASYQQAIALAPAQVVLYRDLANAFLLSGNYSRAEKTIEPILEKGRGDAQCYAVASAIQSALHADKKARKLLDEGLEKYPNSGFLYHELGKYYEEQNDDEEALRAWLDGIRKDAAYHLNYYDAARAYSLSSKPVWTIIYGEIFVNLERYTPRSAEMRKTLIAAYKKFYATPDEADIPGFGKKKVTPAPKNFEEAVTTVLFHLAPVVADGVTTENLTMLRARFAMEWFRVYAVTYPFTLFQMHDDLLRAGHFDAYNQWLFGKAENPAQFDAWNKFHAEAVPAYETYYSSYALQPTAADAYNKANLKGIFGDRQKKNKR